MSYTRRSQNSLLFFVVIDYFYNNYFASFLPRYVTLTSSRHYCWAHVKCVCTSTPTNRHLMQCLRLKQVAQLWQRDRASSINEFRWGDQFEAIMDWTLLFAPLRHDAIYTYAWYGKQTISSTRPSCWIQISTPSTAMREQHCGRPSDVYNTGHHRPPKLTALQTISRWLILKSEKIALWATL